jgi:hypothetical protein
LSHIVLPLSSSFSTYGFLMNTLIFYLASTLSFFQISTLCLYPFWKSFSLSNSSYHIAFSFSPMANLFFKLLTSKFKFPIFRFIIVVVWNTLVAFYICITSAATSSTDFGILVYVIRYSDPSTNVAISYINLLPNSNSNGNPFTNLGILTDTYIFNGPTTTKEGYISTLFICNLICRPSYVCCCWCKCYCKC